MLNSIIQTSINRALLSLEGTPQLGTWILVNFAGYPCGIFCGIGLEGMILSEYNDGEIFYRLCKDSIEAKVASQKETSNCLGCGILIAKNKKFCQPCREIWRTS